MVVIKVGQRVKVNVDAGAFQLKDALGTVYFIDEPNIFNHMYSPIQIELDEPYTEHGQKMLRVTLKEVEVIEN